MTNPIIFAKNAVLIISNYRALPFFNEGLGAPLVILDQKAD